MLAWVFTLYALFGLSFTFGKLTLSHVAPFFVVALRMTISGVLLLGYAYMRHRVHCYPRKKDLWLYAQNIVTAFIIFYPVRAWGMQYMTAAKASLLCNLLPFFAALFAYIQFKERLSWNQFSGLALGFIGMIPLLLSTSSYEEFIGGPGFISWPELAVICAVAALAYSITIVQKLVRHRGCPPPLINGFSMFVGGAITLTSSTMVEPVWLRGSWKIAAVLMIGQIIISNLICSNLHATLLKHYSVTFMAFASFISPLCTIIYGYILLGETVTWHFFVSLAMIVAALALYHLNAIRNHFRGDVSRPSTQPPDTTSTFE